MIEIGVKSDPIQYRYTYDWLLDLMVETGTRYLQLGSFFELYSLDDEYFLALKEKAHKRGIRIKSVFTAHRELGGFISGDKYLEKAARNNYERLIHVASLLGADYCGSNPGAVYRDKMGDKEKGISCFISHMKELSALGKEKGLKALNIEPMSSLAEPPTTMQEIRYMVDTLSQYHNTNLDSTIPVLLCGDISHGLADQDGNVIYKNMELFEQSIPMMSEFHFKNTDKIFNSTFGFSKDELKKGIIDLAEVKQICSKNKGLWPVKDVVGYLEINGPKLGRDYSDLLLGDMLRESLSAIHNVWNTVEVNI